MKRIQELQTLLGIMIWGSVVLMGIGLLVFLYAFITGDFSSIDLKFMGEKIDQYDTFQAIITFFVGIGYLFFFLALFKLKSLVSHFVKRHFFTVKTVALSKKIGQFFILSPVFLYLPPIIYETFATSTTKIMFNFVSPESFFFLIVMGLFFLTLGAIFQEAKKLKEESELTV